MKSGYLTKIEQIEREKRDAMQRTMKQYMLDTCLITMHEDFGWGYDRCKMLEEKWSETYDAYFDAMTIKDEADVMQEKLDNALLSIIGERQEFYPFKERYPEVRRRNYEPRRRK